MIKHLLLSKAVIHDIQHYRYKNYDYAIRSNYMFYLHMIKYESLYAYQFFHMFWGSYENVKLIYIWIFMLHDLHNYYISIYMYIYSIYECLSKCD